MSSKIVSTSLEMNSSQGMMATSNEVMTMRWIPGVLEAAVRMDMVPLRAGATRWVSYWSGLKPSPFMTGDAQWMMNLTPRTASS